MLCVAVLATCANLVPTLLLLFVFDDAPPPSSLLLFGVVDMFAFAFGIVVVVATVAVVTAAGELAHAPILI